MPSLPLRPCSYPGGCPELVASGRCAAHQQQQKQQRTEQRGTTAERGYGADHKRWRVRVFERDRWRCVDCQWEPDVVRVFREAGMPLPPGEEILEELRRRFAKNGRGTKGGRPQRHLHADHVIAIERRPDLALVLSNGATRCNVCHAAKTAREDHGFGNA